MTHESVQQWFSRTAGRLPAHVAIDDGVRRLTYAELEGESNRLANFLLARGAEKGARVAILADDPSAVITSVIGTLKAGGAFVPLDPRRLPAQRLRAMVEEVEPRWVVTEARYLPQLGALADAAAARAGVICLDAAPAAAGGDPRLEDYASFTDADRPDVASAPDDLCYIYFTSGSTGRPKGIAGRLKGLDHFVRWEIKALGLGEGTRVSQLTAPSFDAYLRDVFVPLCSGGTVCVPRRAGDMLDVGELVGDLEALGVNLIHCVPSLFRSIVNQSLDASRFPDLRYVLMAGEPLLPSDVKKWMDVFGERVQLVNLYGPTETTMTKFAYFVTAADKGRRFIPIGKPIEGARALVLDAKGQVCPAGAVGEIYIRTPYRTHGYYNQPELTRAAFVRNPFSDDPHDLVYKTGDLGRILEDGNYEFLGRKDQQVKIRGVRIELREIEDLLSRHEAVREMAVIDADDADGNKYLCAYVVLRDEASAAGLKEFLAQSLPEFMIPSAFVVLDELPRTISGKVDRRALPTPAEARSAQREFVAPRTPLEERVADIWARVLGVERVSIHDNFFELGGHSLLATQLLARVRAALGVEMPLRDLFASPTVAGMTLAVTRLQLEEGDDDEVARLIEEIKGLSEDDLEAALNEGHA